MIRMKPDNLIRNKYSISSIGLSIICLIMTIQINHNIAQRYLSSDGKTQALFGIIETFNFYYQYYFVVLSSISLIFAILGTRKKENRLPNRLAYIIGFLSLIFIFTRIWRLMI